MQDGDVSQARRWYEKAADHGNATAMYNLGLSAQRAAEMDLALDWFERAAESGDCDAMFAFGNLLHESGEVDQGVAGGRRLPAAG